MVPPERRDDESVPDDESVWRRIAPQDLVRDQETGLYRPSSGSLRTSEMSVAIASLTSVESALVDYPGFSLAEIKVAFLRSIGCIVVRDPDPPDNPAHALVYGKSANGSLTKSQAKRLAEAATWRRLVPPPQTDDIPSAAPPASTAD